MICVSIGRGRHKQMIAEHKHLMESGARLVELRLDYLRRDVNVRRLLQDRPCPVVVTCRRDQDGGRWSGSEADRLILLRLAIADGVDYVDLEGDIAGSIPRFGKTQRIVSYHNFRETPADLESIHRQLAAQDADIVKLATMAHNTHDNLRMLQLVKQSRIPTVGICMGEIGTPARILAGKFGAPFTYATFHHERALAPGQLSFQQMTDVYRYDRIKADTAVYGVIADPVGHSLSPLIHNAAFEAAQLNCTYVPFRVPRENLVQFLQDCRELDVKGLSVTIPHKEIVIKYLHKVDGAANGIGAVNTIVFQGTQLVGYNTDMLAALDSLKKACHGHGDNWLRGQTALVLGAGGVSKAVAYGLQQQGADVVMTARTHHRARELAERLGCRHVEWSGRHTVKAQLLVNGTPVGMHPNVDETPFERRFLRNIEVVFDTVYNPEQTLLLKQAREENCRIVTGVEMFVRQAALQFKLFTGMEAPAELMRQELKRATGAAKY